MNEAFAVWWRARGVVTRGLIRITLGVVAVIGVLLFVSFNMSAAGSRASGTKMIVTVGQPGPWLVWERITAGGLVVAAHGTNTTMGMTANSRVDIFSSSFVAGVIALYLVSVLGRIGRIEKEVPRQR